MAEEAFPRGGGGEGGGKKLGREKAVSSSGDFFFAACGSSREWEAKARRKASRQRQSKGELERRAAAAEEGSESVVGEAGLSRSSCTAGMLGLGAVVSISESSVGLELAGGVKAILPAAQVSERLTAAIKAGAVSSLSGLFTLGQLLPVQVTQAVQKGSKKTRKIAAEKKGGAIQ